MGLFRLSIIPLTAIYGVAINGIGTALCYQDFKKPGSIPHTSKRGTTFFFTQNSINF